MLNTIIASIVSVAFLFFLSKLIGNRQMSQMSIFDYVNSITIGSIAAEVAIAKWDEMSTPLIAMAVYAAAVILLSFITSKSLAARRVVNGRCVILFDNGKFMKKDMRRAQIDISEFMTELRISGCFALSELQTAILEPNGHMSFLLRPEYRPQKPADTRLSVEKEKIAPVVISDGEILHENLKRAGMNDIWLERELERLNLKLSDVFHGEVSPDGSLHAYEADMEKHRHDIFG